MKNNKLLVVIIVIALVTIFSFYKKKPVHANMAVDFIESLNAEQRKKILLPFYNLSGHNWHFFPASQSNPDGVAMKALDENQKQKLVGLLQAYLSTKGYDKTKNIMDLEYVLKELNPSQTNRIPENYFVSIYGTPHTDSAWGWSFQGHHLALNFTVVKNKIAFAPFFFGTNPAEIKEGPKKGTRVIKEEEEIAFELVNTFSKAQLQKAMIQQKAFDEIITVNATRVKALPQAGIAITDLTPYQKNILNKLIGAYLSSMPKELAAMRLKKMEKEDLNAIYFGWAGAIKTGEGHYYRIQGKTFLVEFDNTQNNANHIHTVWRDFNGDFGRDLLNEHYKTAHQH
ncbi:MAG: DUF3500 domain-containing protein [Bacteroidota bacterium]